MPHFTRRLTTWLFAILTLASTASAGTVDLTGEWEIQEEERTYTATLDRDGNGTYTWQNGRIATTSSTDGRWEGLWTQTGNDREGGFEIQLSSDGSRAEGKWWYTRVGQTIIPPREWGGPYTWKRLTPAPVSSSAP
ncbi:MAG: hypothetical protein E6K60_09445 [Nitrospirae bacterium]|nr:MAG: hypothetical protein E6K60_09445 [Nitrospirota bacterium]